MPMVIDEAEAQGEKPLPAKRCKALTKAGKQCRSTAVGQDSLCSYHSGRTLIGTGELQVRAVEGQRKRRLEKVEARRKDALDWAAEAVKAHGYEIADAFVQAAKRGDWRASQALMDRIYGKPEETLHRVEHNPAAQVLKSMSLDEKLELLARLQGVGVDSAHAVPMVIDP